METKVTFALHYLTKKIFDMKNQNSVKLKTFFYVVSLNVHYSDSYLKIDSFPIRILSKDRPDMTHRNTRSLVFKLFRQSIKKSPICKTLNEPRIVLHNDLFDRVVTSIDEPSYDYCGNVYTIDGIDISGSFYFGSRVFELYSRDEIFELSRKNTIQLEYGTYKIDDFVPDGYITVANWGGYEVMLSECNSMAKIRDSFGSDSPKVSNWLEIEYIENDEIGECEPIIDPKGYNISLNDVMLARF